MVVYALPLENESSKPIWLNTFWVWCSRAVCTITVATSRSASVFQPNPASADPFSLSSQESWASVAGRHHSTPMETVPEVSNFPKNWSLSSRSTTLTASVWTKKIQGNLLKKTKVWLLSTCCLPHKPVIFQLWGGTTWPMLIWTWRIMMEELLYGGVLRKVKQK